MRLSRLFLTSIIYFISIDYQKAGSIAISGKHGAESSGDVRQRVFPGLSGSARDVQHMLQARGPRDTGVQNHKPKSEKKAIQELQELKSMETALDETGRASDKDKKGVDRYIERLTSILTNFTDKHKNGKHREKPDGTKKFMEDVVQTALDHQDEDGSPDEDDDENEEDEESSKEEFKSDKLEKVSTKKWTNLSWKSSKKEEQDIQEGKEGSGAAGKAKKNNDQKIKSEKAKTESKKMKQKKAKDDDDDDEDESEEDTKETKSRRSPRAVKHGSTQRSQTRSRSGRLKRSIQILKVARGDDDDDDDDYDDDDDDYEDEVEADMELVQALRSTKKQPAEKINVVPVDFNPGMGKISRIEILHLPQKQATTPSSQLNTELLQLLTSGNFDTGGGGGGGDTVKRRRHRHRRPHGKVKVVRLNEGPAPQPAPAAAPPPAPAAAAPPAPAAAPPPAGAPPSPPGLILTGAS